MSDRSAPVTIDREACVGHGRCYSKAPEMFYSDELALGHVKDVVDDTEKPTNIARIIRACPEGAIHLVETH